MYSAARMVRGSQGQMASHDSAVLVWRMSKTGEREYLVVHVWPQTSGVDAPGSASECQARFKKAGLAAKICFPCGPGISKDKEELERIKTELVAKNQKEAAEKVTLASVTGFREFLTQTSVRLLGMRPKIVHTFRNGRKMNTLYFFLADPEDLAQGYPISELPLKIRSGFDLEMVTIISAPTWIPASQLLGDLKSKVADAHLDALKRAEGTLKEEAKAAKLKLATTSATK